VNLIKEKSILIIAPSLIAESLSLKLTSINTDLNISLDSKDKSFFPDLIIWNILNYQSEDLIRIELLKLKEGWPDSQILIIFSGEIKGDSNLPKLNCEGLLYNPGVEKVLQSIDTIINGGRVFDIEKSNFIENKNIEKPSLNNKILSSGLKQIDIEINHILYHLNNIKTPSFYKFILRGRLRELITAKSLLIFLWGRSLNIYSDQTFSENLPEKGKINKDDTVFIKEKDSKEIWKLIFKRLISKYSLENINIENNDSTIILSGLKKEYISKLLCNIIYELDNLINNINDNYFDDSYKEEYEAFIDELKKKSISNITDNYLRVKKENISISINEYILKEFKSIGDDLEAHDYKIFLEPIINNEPLIFDGKILPLYETESFKAIESIISNWVIRTSNILASEIFSFCSNWPELRTTLINSQLQSTRHFERFRNSINNFNRWHNNFYMPIYLYESKREYIDITNKKFIRYYKNENRELDLKKLEWIQRQVTLLIEIKDAIAPQLDVALKYLGNIFVTLLTKVLGKAIGLIGKGILQGLGRSNSK
tara:strand:+ start:6582 stop:8204 length:1623 start_codon:yes stop_codon:yes gene_type:complete